MKHVRRQRHGLKDLDPSIDRAQAPGFGIQTVFFRGAGRQRHGGGYQQQRRAAAWAPLHGRSNPRTVIGPPGRCLPFLLGFHDCAPTPARSALPHAPQRTRCPFLQQLNTPRTVRRGDFWSKGSIAVGKRSLLAMVFILPCAPSVVYGSAPGRNPMIGPRTHFLVRHVLQDGPIHRGRRMR